MTENSNSNNSDPKPEKPGFLRVLQSVLAAMFGVQSESKRKEDFEKGSAAEYIFVGIIMVIVFILSIMWFVSSAIEDYKGG